MMQTTEIAILVNTNALIRNAFDGSTTMRRLADVLTDARIPQLARMFDGISSALGLDHSATLSSVNVMVGVLPSNALGMPDCWVLLDIAASEPSEMVQATLASHVSDALKEFLAEDGYVPSDEADAYNVDARWQTPALPALI